MKKQTYLAVDLHTYTNNTTMQTNEARQGSLIMTEDYERFTFIENAPAPKHRRNPKVFYGRRINVARKTDGQLVVSLHRTMLTDETNIILLANEIYTELFVAKRELFG